MRIVYAGLNYDLGLSFSVARPEQLLRVIRQKIPFHHQLANLGMQLVEFCRAHCSGADPRRVNAVAMFSIAARFHVPICVG